MYRLIWCVLALLLGARAFSAAVSAADYARAERLMPYNTEELILHAVHAPAWLPNGQFSYRTRTAGGMESVLVDARKGTVERSAAAAAGERSESNPNEVTSPDARRVAFIRDFNLWIREVNGGAETQLTTDGVKDFGYATDNAGWWHSARAVVLWSPDSKRIATFQQDERGVGESYLVSTQPGHTKLDAWKNPMSGDEVIPKVHRVILDVEARRVIRLQIAPDPLRSASFYSLARADGQLADASWSEDSTQLVFISTSRDFKRTQLRVADAASGTVREVLEEQVPTQYESDSNWRWLQSSRQVLWPSARDNWNHLYLYDFASGRLRRQLTSGDWNVTQVLRVDERRREVFFLAAGREAGRDPYFEHLYKVSLDGGRPVLLTPENANHEVWMSPEGEYFVSSFSTPQTPPVAVLRNRQGKQIRMLEQADISKLRAIGWQAPVSITVKARDGRTDLHGLMFRPSDFDERQRYPIINSVYPGPSIGSVQQRKFSVSRGMGDAHSLAELGFIVVQIDGMGTPTRSKAFRDATYGDLGDNTLPDQVAGMKELARRYPWIDASRAGIYGISGGGYATARALFEYPDFFKVGIAINGNHDQRSYTDNWGEKWMGLLERRPDGTSNYDGQANQNIASRLQGHLMLVYSTLDDNVPPNSTLLLIDALIKANKDFDLLALPNERHWPVGQAADYLVRRRWDYFVRYLQENTPPKEFAIHAAHPANEERS
jgi:dipeptidyl aminopeptidase/acylaminoacyl peptidase